MTTKTKLTIRSTDKINGHDPDLQFALYPCEQVNASIETLTDHYPVTHGDGYEHLSDLRYLSFEVVEYGTLFSGYWCEKCIEAIGRQPGNTLAEDLRRGMMREIGQAVGYFIR